MVIAADWMADPLAATPEFGFALPTSAHELLAHRLKLGGRGKQEPPAHAEPRAC